MDSYLYRFETHATALGWPRAEWHVDLAGLLRGKALTVYHELARRDTLNYDSMKEGLLKRYLCSEEGFRTKFRSIRPEKDEPMQIFLARTEHVCDRWFDLAGVGTDFAKARDVILREQLLKSVSPSLATYLKERKYSSAKEMMETAALYREAHKNEPVAAKNSDIWPAGVGVPQDNGSQFQFYNNRGRGRGYQRQSNRGGFTQNQSSQGNTEQSTGQSQGNCQSGVNQQSSPSGTQVNDSGGRSGQTPSGVTTKSHVTCFKCNRKGHIARDCK
ncbi:hypothetical protein BaRGS_00016606 [Batillaria attramentaria]|uniref:CCHC-type domain-containing protein n=1 Tax=Batillaria attramentaria TaxID=370345 RepID=A0ABD0KZE8_9CAEN